MRTTYATLLFIVFLAAGCSKDYATSGGSSNLVYETESEIDLRTNMQAVINTSTLYIENATPYYQIMGQIAADASETRIDGNGIEISNIEISDVKISEISVTCTENLTGLRDLLSNCTLDLQYYDIPTNSYTGLTLGTFTQVNMQSAMVEFALNQNDLSSFLKNRPDKMFLKFNFNSALTNSIKVNYRIVFSYTYSYDERERKK